MANLTPTEHPNDPIRDQAIAGVMEHFNFASVHTAMVALDWKWGVPFSATEMEVPSLDRIKEQARDLLIQVWDDNEPDLESGIGGFRGSRNEDGLLLQFVLDQSHVDLRSHADSEVDYARAEKVIDDAVKRLKSSERGRETLKGLRLLMDHSYSLDAENIDAVKAVLNGFYGSMTGTASAAVDEATSNE